MEEYSRRIQFYSGSVPLLLSEQLLDTPWKSCVDLGCGDGALLHDLMERGYLSDKTIYALDSSVTRISQVQKISDEFQCIVGDACNTNLPDSSVDVVISTQTIEHVESDADMVKEIDRILSPDGIAYIATVFKKRYAWYFYRCNGKWTIDPTHLREYTQDDQLLDLFDHQGFRVLKNKKTSDSRSLSDAILRRVGAGRLSYRNRVLSLFRNLKVPIPGYFIWEIVLKKA